MFGSTPAATPSFFGGGFGTQQPQQPSSSLFGNSGFGGFGAAPASSAPAPAFGFGTTTTTAPSFFGGFGTANQQPQTQTQPLFAGFGAPAQPQAQPSAFGNFGQPAAQPQQQTSIFGTGSLFGGAAQQPQAGSGSPFGAAQPTVTPEADYAARLAACVQNPFLFGDERDQILAKFNSVQATMGCGKAYYAHNQPPLEMNPENVFCKWKCVVYMPKQQNTVEEGLVGLIFNKKATEVYDVRSELAELIHKVLGERQHIMVEVDGVNPLPNDKCELLFHVIERLNDGNNRRVPSVDVHAFLMQPQTKANLQSMLVEDIHPRVPLTKEMEKLAMEKVPTGMSSYMWYQAQKDNPDPENLIPVPVIGFTEMYDLLKKESGLASLSKDVCRQIESDVRKLEKKVEENKQVTQSYQEKLDKFILRQLHVFSSQPTISRLGQPLTSFETNLCDQVSQMKSVMEAPEKNLRNRAQELSANIQLHDRYLTEKAKRQPRIDSRSLTETEKDDVAKACELLISVLDACKDKIKEEKDLLLKLLYDQSTGNA